MNKSILVAPLSLQRNHTLLVLVYIFLLVPFISVILEVLHLNRTEIYKKKEQRQQEDINERIQRYIKHGQLSRQYAQMYRGEVSSCLH
jgi:hypothetical protein